MSNEQASKFLSEYTAKCDDDVGTSVPMRSDGSPYVIEDLAEDQKEALADVLHALRLFFSGTSINADNLLQMTVCGVAGSGKSTWINTLVPLLREMFPNDNAVSVFAPTGSAAFNAGGQTLHKGFYIPTKAENFSVC